MQTAPRSRAVACLAVVAGLAAGLLLETRGAASPQATGGGEAFIEGTLEVEVRGTGAAPFGIAAGLTTGVGVGYNLARLQNFELPVEVEGFSGSERYKARVRFTLRGDDADRWVLHSLTVVYDFHDGTTINYDAEARVVDAFGDAGSASWRNGAWSDTTVELGEPSIVFERADDGRWKFSAEIHHPVRPSGTSSWSSPMGEVEVSAAEGLYQYSARDFMGNELPFPMPPMDHSSSWTWASEFEEPWDGEGEFVAFDTSTVLTGADAYEILRLRPMSPALYKVDASQLPGSMFEVRAAVEGPDPQPLKWMFTLYEISCERGNELNDDPEGRWDDCEGNGAYDMELFPYGGFEAPVEWDNGSTWTIETSEEVVDVMLPVLADDHGAWAKLRADVWIDGEWVPVRVAESDNEYITLPLDEAGGRENRIADGWERQWGLAGVDPRLDDETSPAGATAGDGLSIYEEYRGFEKFPNGYQRTDPTRKTLFVQPDPVDLLRGVRLFERASGLEVVVLAGDDYTGPEDRLVNFNGGFAHVVDQHAVYMRYATEAEQRDCLPGEDRRASGCGSLGSATGMSLGSPLEDGRTPGRTEVVLIADSDVVSATIAHEIGHSVGLQHHGNLDFRRAWVVNGEYSHCEPGPCTPPEGARIRYIAVPGGEHSGRLACLMSYDAADGYTATGALNDVARTPDGQLIPFPRNVARSRFCSDNSPSPGSPVGHASNGDCRHQFRVSDGGS